MEPLNGLPFTNEQLKEAGLLGEGVSQSVKRVLKMMAEHPGLIEPSLFALQCLNSNYKSLSSPASPTLGDASTASSTLPIASNTTAVAPNGLSDQERTTYYHGISPDPPELLYRSDFPDNPFSKPVGRFHLPTKSVHGVFGTPLNPVWHTVRPQICNILKARKIRYSSINTVHFVTHGEDNMDSLGPIVIWISVYPNTTTAKDAHDASADILAILEANGVKGAVVEWCEAVVVRL
ncbi:hypothetical protein PISMIDRAFT_687535 [Pisolithus microcarpus 441]|uniref:Uncharacterized protein n=1 Tax=Pisolithus microcarpus 441 TaxID=765257 RepID=A0A0C9Z4X8_9AGAM|nr:hypothetical protein PISMIDRAFT_687535 [Pisolithus microcarpus 441]